MSLPENDREVMEALLRGAVVVTGDGSSLSEYVLSMSHIHRRTNRFRRDWSVWGRVPFFPQYVDITAITVPSEAEEGKPSPADLLDD